MLALAAMTKRPRRRRVGRRILRIAAIGAIGAWLVRRQRSSKPSAEGEWQDYFSPETPRRSREP